MLSKQVLHAKEGEGMDDKELLITGPELAYKSIQEGIWSVDVFKRWLFLCIMADFHRLR